MAASHDSNTPNLADDQSGLATFAAIVGGAIIPLAQGFIADRVGLHRAFFLPVACYLYILFYGFIGSRLREPATLVLTQ